MRVQYRARIKRVEIDQGDHETYVRVTLDVDEESTPRSMLTPITDIVLAAYDPEDLTAVKHGAIIAITIETEGEA